MTCFQKQPLVAEAENSLTTLNKKILEIKKKIQLSEGQRKAHFEENDTEIRLNGEKINKLKNELKIVSEELAIAKTEMGGEKQFRLVKYLHEMGNVGNKNHDQLKQILDLKVIDLHKQVDIVRYEKKKKKMQLDKMEMEYQKLLTERAKTCGDGQKTEKTSRKVISQLENDIHRIAVQWREAEHVKKKYNRIRYSLLNDSVKFESALAKVEDMIKQQNEEIKKLQAVNASAMQMRNSAMSLLLQQESRVAAASGARSDQLMMARQKLAQRHAELDKLERRIFPPSRPTLVQQDSVGSAELATVEEENGSLLGGTNLDEVFQKLMKMTGVSDPELVFDRFKAQKATTERLFYLKNSTEEEKRRLEADQGVMVAELEAYKFAQVKDKEENQEEMENLKIAIQNELEKQQQYEKERQQILDALLDIKRCFYDCCLKLEEADDVKLPDWSEDMDNLEEIFQLLKNKYLAALQIAEQPEIKEKIEEYLSPKVIDERRPSHETVHLEKQPSEERSALPAAYQELLAPRNKSRNTNTPSGPQPKVLVSDEEEEIPSRGFLKRQAQLIVDTKSRRKGFRIPLARK